MTEPKRPVTGGKSTPRTEKKREEALDDGLRITIEGEVYEVRDGDITPQLARELRAASGMSYIRLVQTVRTDPDIDVLSAFVWLSRRLDGDPVDIDEVAVSYDAILADGFDVTLPGAEKLDASNPEG